MLESGPTALVGQLKAAGAPEGKTYEYLPNP